MFNPIIFNCFARRRPWETKLSPVCAHKTQVLAAVRLLQLEGWRAANTALISLVSRSNKHLVTLTPFSHLITLFHSPHTLSSFVGDSSSVLLPLPQPVELPIAPASNATFQPTVQSI